MNNNLKIFNNEYFGQVRVTEVDGKPYLVASDVTKALGYSNQSKAIKDHCRYITKCYTPHPQNKLKQIEVNVIPEGDVYRLIVKSKLPSAEKFERWVFDEVLPQIRQTGGYIPVNEEESDEEFLARALIVAQNTLKKKELLLKQKEQQLIEQKPKVDYYDTVINSGELLTATTIAKDLGVSAKRLNAFLHENKIIYKRGGIWHVYSQYDYFMKEGYADYETAEGFTYLKWTQKGRKFIIDMWMGEHSDMYLTQGEYEELMDL